MRAVNLDNINTSPDCSDCRTLPIFHHLTHLLQGQPSGLPEPTLGISLIPPIPNHLPPPTWPYNVSWAPPTHIPGSPHPVLPPPIRSPTDPRRSLTRFPACMRQLNPQHCTLRVHKVRHGLDPVDLRVRPQSSIVRTDAPAGLYGRRLNEDEPRALERVVAECRDVIWRQGAGCGPAGGDGVLAHWGDDDSVFEGEGADGQWLEQRWDLGGAGGRVGGARGDFVLRDEVGGLGDGRI